MENGNDEDCTMGSAMVDYTEEGMLAFHEGLEGMMEVQHQSPLLSKRPFLGTNIVVVAIVSCISLIVVIVTCCYAITAKVVRFPMQVFKCMQKSGIDES